MTARLAALHVYPIKSAAGIACEKAVLGPCGLEHDREWMVVDASGRFVTQRDESRLALLGTAIHAGRLQLSNPEGVGPAVDLQHEGQLRRALVWRSECSGFDAGDEVAGFLSGWLGRPLRLVRFDQRQQRLANHDWTRGQDVPTLFSDGFPMLVLSRASVDDLSARVGQALPVERFRPNIVLDGVEPYAEDAMQMINIGAARVVLTKACTRCVITTIDHARGERAGEEPLATLRRYRFDRELRGVVFGRNAYAVDGVGSELACGMAVTPAPA